MNKIKEIEEYLMGQMAPEDTLLFEVDMLLDNEFSDDVQLQQITYAIVRKYGRQKIKAEIIAVQENLKKAQKHKGFMQRITNLFKNH
ncbi:MAG: hypothetical protein ABWY16_00615 [Pedobacter sp.]|uniref:hypothetical protein n=1 Tax=Pedobacter sp. TaxID=1411316 RepID=UPI0033996E5A